jgi:hypothetical protein
MTHMNQISPIVMYNAGDVETSEPFGECVCCGEPAQTHGVCIACVTANCPTNLSERCSRTARADPLDLAEPDYAYKHFE